MKIQDLKKLMGSLSLHEKIGQLVQLDGGFFGAEEVPTGPCDEMGIAPWVVENAGSVLNVLGVNKVQEVQQHSRHHHRPCPFGTSLYCIPSQHRHRKFCPPGLSSRISD